MKTRNQPINRRRIAPLGCLAALCFALAPLSACAAESDVQAVAENERVQAIDAAKAKLNEMGFKGVIAVAWDGETPSYAGFGDIIATSGLPDAETLVDIASITKTITGAAAMTLVDQGKLSMADRLGDYFPDAPADKIGITVHQLLTHSAGFGHAVGRDHDYLSKEEFLKRAMADPLLFEPGSAYEYSNVGFSLVAAIIETLSEKSYEDFIREDLLGSLDDRGIGYEAAFDAERSILTKGGETIDLASWGGRSHWTLIGNGGLVASARDMIAFLRAYEGGALHSRAAIELSHAPMVREGENAPSHYGYGLVVENHPQFGRTYWHNGGSRDFTANWTHYADHGLIVFTASNGTEVDADSAAMIIAKSLLRK